MHAVNPVTNSRHQLYQKCIILLCTPHCQCLEAIVGLVGHYGRVYMLNAVIKGIMTLLFRNLVLVVHVL